jgi:natural product biosynthesis luciferase-like monooxygenase protein
MNVLGFSGLAHSISFKRREFSGLTEREYNIAQGLDAAAALVSSGEIIAAAAEERFNRHKASNAFPVHAIRFCFEHAKLSDMDFIAHGFCYEPHRKTIEADDYGRRQYSEVFTPGLQKQLLSDHFGPGDWDKKFISVPHHLAHAASTFYPSGFNDALILVSDGMGEVSSMTVCVGQGTNITELAQVSAFHSLGALYGIFTLHLGFYMNSDEYKVMGLAPYGNPRRYFDEIMRFISLKEDGTYTIPLFAHNQTLLERETHRGVLKVLSEKFGPAREPEAGITQTHKDIAAALQAVLQTTQLHVLRHFKRQTGLKNLCLAGGVALNCSTNGVIRRSDLFENLFVQPAAGDDGTALGAALYAERLHNANFTPRKMTVPLWGPEFSPAELSAAIHVESGPRLSQPQRAPTNGRATEFKTPEPIAAAAAETAPVRSFDVVPTASFTELCKEVALRINHGEIIAWFQNRMEFGPRALGSRSILADPRDGGMRERINALVKKREGFRPFAPVVTREKAAEIFEIRPGQEETFSHMLYVTHVRGPYRDKLPATTHVDGSARAQTVSRQQNPKLWQLLKAFEGLSGIPVLLNTSFNVRGQPIVCSPPEAIDTFLAARLDALVLGDTLLVPRKLATNVGSAHHLTREELEEAAARNEEFWVNRLCSLQPVTLPYPHAHSRRREEADSPIQDNPPPHVIGRAEAQLPPEQIVAAFAAFIARITSVETFDLAYNNRRLTEQLGDLKTAFAAWLPANFNVHSNQNWQEICASVRDELSKVRDHSTYNLDVISRHPALRSNGQATVSKLPLALRFCTAGEECELAPGSELTLNIRETGTHVSERARTRQQAPGGPVAQANGHPDFTGARSEACSPEFLWCFDPTVFDRETVKGMVRQFEHFLRLLIAKPQTPLRSLTLLSHEQWSTVIEQWNATDSDFPQVQMHEPFEEHAAKAPDSIALVFLDRQLTYGELNAHAEALAADLRSAGVQPDEPVGVHIDVSLEMMVGLLAVLKAGGAYLPLDPTFPKDRVAFMLEDSKAHIVLTSSELQSQLPPTNAQIVCIDPVYGGRRREEADANAPSVPPSDVGRSNPSPQNLAYVIYTSGSTGKPKGVMIEHRNVANFYHAMDKVLGTEPGVWLAVTSISFDISILELFWTLSRGFKVVLEPKARASTKPERGTSRPAARPHDISFSLFYFAADEGLQTSQKYRLLLEGAKFADAHGFEAIWTPERHFHSFGGLYPNPSVTSAAVAAITRRIHIRAGSVVAPLHDPIRIAEEWSAVDNLSNGRVGISFASGWQINDFILRPDNYAARKERMLEYISVVRRLWRGETIERTAPNGTKIPIRILPRPVQPELPIWITASGNPETFKLAGELGASVLTHLLGQNFTELKGKIALYREAWKQAGHAGMGHVTLMLHTYIHKDGRIARETVRKPFTAYLRTSADLIRNDPWAFSTFKRPATLAANDRDLKNVKLSEQELDAMAEHAFERHFETSGLFGTPEHCLELIQKFQAVGVNEIGCLIDFGLPEQTVLDGLHELGALQELFADDGVRTSSSAAMHDSQTRFGTAETPNNADIAPGEDFPTPLEMDYSIPTQILRHKVTHLQCTPSLAAMLLEDSHTIDALKSLKKLLLGGEALPLSLMQKLDIPGEILNMYGPTETTIWSAVTQINRSDDLITIGRPIANTRFYIVDKDLRPVPVGIPGELLIGGAGVVRGYLDRPELTADKFIANPFETNGAESFGVHPSGCSAFGVHPLGCSTDANAKPGGPHPKGWTSNHQKLYRTGDLARYLPDGRIEFLGRLDQQVKLRGYRIELGEIETVLQQHPAIRDCAAIVREDIPGDKRLVAYFIQKDSQQPEPRELRQFLRSCLPDYMVPSAFVPLPAFPLTPNGKLDRKALPRPDAVAAAKPSEAEAHTSNLTEAKIAAVMCGLLGVKRIGLKDDFFELGGNSLLATQLIARLRQAFCWELPLRLAFEFPTVESLAYAISGTPAATRPDMTAGNIPLSSSLSSVVLLTKEDGAAGEASVKSDPNLGRGEEAPTILSAPKPYSLPLSFAQQRIWFLHQLEPGPHYNDHFDLRIRGPLDPAALERAINEIIRRHQTLRSTFKDRDGRPQLVVLSELKIELPFIDLTNKTERTSSNAPQSPAESDNSDAAAALAEATRLAAEDCQKPFDLENGPLLRTKLVRMAQDDHLLILTFDHIAVDGWSHGVFLSELTVIYQAFLQGRPSPLPELTIQYSDYAAWKLQQFEQGTYSPHLEYWKRQLKDAPRQLKLPTDFPRPEIQTYRGAREFFRLDRELMDKVSALGRAERCTSYMVLLAAFQVLLARHSGQADFVIGTPVANRNRADVEPLIGSFMNTLAVRTNLSGEPTFRELLGRVRHVVLDALAYQDMPFEKLVAELQPERVLGYGPIFQVMFILQNTPPPLSQAGHVTFRHFDIDGGSSKMDFTFNLEETAEGAEGWFEYATDLFKPETIRRLVASYIQLLEELCARPKQRVGIIEPPTQAPISSILPQFNHSNGNGNQLPPPQPSPSRSGRFKSNLPQSGQLF